MPQVPEQLPFEMAVRLLEQRIQETYGLRLVTRDIPDPLTGDLNGAEIDIDYAVTPAERLFLLAHLFGHTVQWNTDPAAYEMGRPQQPPVEEVLMPELMQYEATAAQYGLQLLHDCGLTQFDQWLSDYTAADRAYLAHFYRTGRARKFQNFWQDGTPLVTPLVIPNFVPHARAFRTDGIVI